MLNFLKTFSPRNYELKIEISWTNYLKPEKVPYFCKYEITAFIKKLI
jgi:hypothetical protein